MKIAHNRINEVGNVYGQLTVLEYEKTIGKTIYWLCRCNCGKIKSVTSSQLRRKDRKKTEQCEVCGYNKRIKHNHTGKAFETEQSLTYVSWHSMVTRIKRDERYTEKGIDENWLSFENFLKDMGERPTKNHSIDRIDGSQGYFPGNCRWATKTEQAHNLSTNIWIELYGERKVLKQWIREYGLSQGSYYHNRSKGRPPEEIIKWLLDKKLYPEFLYFQETTSNASQWTFDAWMSTRIMGY